MRWTSRSVLAIGIAATLGACAADEAPTGPSSPDFHYASGTSSCKPYDVKQLTKYLLGESDPAVGLAGQINHYNAGQSAATALGFDIMERIAAFRNASTGWTDAQSTKAARLTLLLIDCMGVEVTGPYSQAIFEAAFAETGGYEVRGGPSDQSNTVLAKDERAGIMAPAAFGTWLPGRALFFGRPIESFSTEIYGGYAYDWSLVRAPGWPAQLSPAATVALCSDDSPDDVIAPQLRVQHKPIPAGGVILPVPGEVVDFLECPTAETLGSGPHSIFRRLADIMLPQPLFAAVAGTGGIGGLAGSFSPFEVVYPGEVQFGFVSEPAEAQLNSEILGNDGQPIAVRAGGAGGTPWQGVEVRIEARINNGATVVVSCNLATTDASGIARFPNLSINKPGGYFLVASTLSAGDADVETYSAVLSSSRFHVKPLKGPGTGSAPVCN